MIANTIKKYKLKNMITYLYKISDVSRSGYYRYFCEKAIATRKYKEEKDEILRENVLKAFNFKNRKIKGAIQVKMVLKGEFNLVYNLKRIRRIMKKHLKKCYLQI